MNYYIDFAAHTPGLNKQDGDPVKDNAEKRLREFIFNKSNTLRLTRYSWQEGILFFSKKKGDDNDPDFVKAVTKLKPYFIKREINNKKYYDVVQPLNQQYEHYYYELSMEVKVELNKSTLLFPVVWEANISFYGFEDPTFYYGDRLLASVISHEQQVFLELSTLAADELKNKGVYLEHIEM